MLIVLLCQFQQLSGPQSWCLQIFNYLDPKVGVAISAISAIICIIWVCRYCGKRNCCLGTTRCLSSCGFYNTAGGQEPQDASQVQLSADSQSGASSKIIGWSQRLTSHQLVGTRTQTVGSNGAPMGLYRGSIGAL